MIVVVVTCSYSHMVLSLFARSPLFSRSRGWAQCERARAVYKFARPRRHVRGGSPQTRAASKVTLTLTKLLFSEKAVLRNVEWNPLTCRCFLPRSENNAANLIWKQSLITILNKKTVLNKKEMLQT